MFSELLKAPVSRLVIFLCVVTLLACPGALIIWMMDPVEFKAFNAFQLIVLSVALIMPFIILNAVVVCAAFPLHRWVQRTFRYKLVRRPREAVVAAASVFAGAIGTTVPAYAPIVAHLFGRAKAPREMALVAIVAEVVPLAVLAMINPTTYWQGRDEEEKPAATKRPERNEMAINLNLIRTNKPSVVTATITPSEGSTSGGTATR